MLVVCLDDNGLFASNRVKVVAAITNEIWPVTAEWLKDCHEGHSSLNIEAYKVNEVDSDDEDFGKQTSTAVPSRAATKMLLEDSDEE